MLLNIGHFEENPNVELFLVTFEDAQGELGPPVTCLAEEISAAPVLRPGVLPEREDALQQVRHTTRPPNTSPCLCCQGPRQFRWDAQPNPFRQFAGCEQWPLPLLADSLTRPLQALS